MCDHTPLAPATDKTLAPRAVVQSAWRAHPGGTQDARGDGKAAWGLEFVLLFSLLRLDTFVLFCISSIMNMIL